MALLKDRRLAVPRTHQIYAYCNIRTNQVLYSLTRFLEPRALDQLPDLGANNKPASLRKDSWRPLFTLSFPATKSGAAQGLHAFTALRQWRSLHETQWEPPEELARPYTKAHIEELEKKREERGGSKKETIYDYIKRQKKKLRVRLIMDQKANSIADLAEVLTQQEKMSGGMASRHDRWKTRQLEEMVKLGDEESYETRMEDLTATMMRLQKTRSALRSRKQREEKIRVGEQLYIVMQNRAKLAFALKNVRRAQKEVKKAAQLAAAKQPPTEAENAAELAPSGNGDTSSQASHADEGTPTSSTETSSEPKLSYATSKRQLYPYLDYFPESMAKIGVQFLAPKLRGKYIQKDQGRAPPFSNESIKVSWADIMNAELAQVWPGHVQHERMTLDKRRHGASKAEETLEERERKSQAEEEALEQATWEKLDGEQPSQETLQELMEQERVEQQKIKMEVIAQENTQKLAQLEKDIEKEVQRRFRSWGAQKRSVPNALENLRGAMRAQMGGKLRRLRRSEKMRLKANLRALEEDVSEPAETESTGQMDLSRLGFLKEIQSTMMEEVRARAVREKWKGAVTAAKGTANVEASPKRQEITST